MKALVARVNAPSVQRYALMVTSLVLGLVACTLVG